MDERFAMSLFGIVLALSGIQLWYAARKKAALAHEQESHNRMMALLQSIADDYVCLIDVDLDTELEEQFRIHKGDFLGDWAGGNYDYNHCIENYAQTVVGPADRERFKHATRLSVLKEVLKEQKDFFIEYDAVVDGEKRRFIGKFTLNQDNGKTPHMLVGIRDITVQTEERIRAQTSMDLIVSAASTVYPFIMEQNLNRNEAQTIYNHSIAYEGLLSM